MSRALGPLLTVVACLSLLPADARAGKREDLLQADVDELQRQAYDLKRMLEKQSEEIGRLLELLDGTPEARRERSAFNANIDGLRADLRALGGRFDDATQRLSELERRVAECIDRPAATAQTPGLVPGAGEDGLAGEATPAAGRGPDTGGQVDGDADRVFQQAYGDYSRNNFAIAIGEFREYLAKNPGGPHAHEARYWLGLSLMRLNQLDEAVVTFDELLERHPRAANIPDTLYRKGEALLQLNRVGQAVLVFNEVVSKYPSSQAATQAAERLRELASETR